jgi:hypothetical protein
MTTHELQAAPYALDLVVDDDGWEVWNVVRADGAIVQAGIASDRDAQWCLEEWLLGEAAPSR